MPEQILVMGGCPYESIDGVRHYANHSRPRWHGHAVAHYLAAAGKRVTLLHTPSLYRYDTNIIHTDRYHEQPIVNTRQLLDAMIELAQSHRYDVILQLANIPAICPASTSEHKLKVKKDIDGTNPVLLDICGNIDISGILHDQLNAIACAGYNQHQSWFCHDPQHTIEPLHHLIRDALRLPAPDFATIIAQPGTSSNELAGRKIIVSSGPTVEFISTHGDCISNFSSGKQGYAIANALANMGAQVVLVSGPVQLPAPTHDNIITQYVESTRQMHDAIMLQLPADAYIGVAAVADFYVSKPDTLHLPPGKQSSLSLSQNPDILHTVATHPTQRPRKVIGFAAETHDLIDYARDKLKRKHVDAICANDASVASGDHNHITWITAHDTQHWITMSKIEVGRRIGLSLAAMLAHD
jgi:phosphopantothenoylcysteine synthetase/decarboxylase